MASMTGEELHATFSSYVYETSPFVVEIAGRTVQVRKFLCSLHDDRRGDLSTEEVIAFELNLFTPAGVLRNVRWRRLSLMEAVDGIAPEVLTETFMALVMRRHWYDPLELLSRAEV